MPIVNCDYCEKEFHLKPYRIKRARNHFCSNSCKDKFLIKTITLNCDFCGKQIEKWPSLIKGRVNHFCDRECSRKFKTKKPEYNYQNKEIIKPQPDIIGLKGIIEVDNHLNRKQIEYIINENGCWECVSHFKNTDGYIKIRISGKLIFIHRYIYEKYIGLIPDGQIILHSCDNPACINPGHLRAGTKKDNAQDMGRRKRNFVLIGHCNNAAKLTDQKVIEIRNSQLKTSELATIYNVSTTTIYNIIKRKIWKHV